jgi:predicted acyltransferase
MLGVILRSIDEPQTKWTFEDTLSQIGLGYPALFALGCFSTRTRWIALVAILLGFWTFFALWSGTGHPTEVWQHHFSGFAAHWNLNANAAWAFDTWFLNLFPRKEPFIANHGGYSTLSFIPTLGTMLLGLFAGQWLRDRTSEGQVLKKLTIAGATCLAVGLISHWSGLCPSVKKIWTPSWTLVSGGWCFLLLASFFFIIDVKGWSRWAYFFIVIGLNSVTIYVMSWTTHSFFAEMLTTHLGHAPFRVFGKAFEHTLHGAAVLAIWWAILHWMHRRKLYLRF